MKTKIISALILLVLAVPLIINTVFAAELTIPKPRTLPGLTSGEQAEEDAGKKYVGESILPAVVQFFIFAAGIGSLVFMIIGAIKYMTAYGNEESMGEAKRTIIFAVVGFLIAIFSYAIVALIISIKLDTRDARLTPASGQTYIIERAYAAYNESKSENILENIYQEGSEGDNIKHLPFAKNIEEPGIKQHEFIAQSLYPSIIKLALGIASVLIIVSFIVAGTMYVTAQGQEEQLKKAKEILIYTVVATIIIASAYAITLGVGKLKDYFWQ